jgi:hypothetical protein
VSNLRILHNEVLRDLRIGLVISLGSYKGKQTVRVAKLGETRNACRISAWKLLGKRPLGVVYEKITIN